MKVLIAVSLFILCSFLGSCAEFRSAPPAPAKLIQYSGAKTWQLSDLSGLSVQEFTVIVFKEKITAKDWNSIFQQTKKLALLRDKQAKLTLSISNSSSVDTSSLEEERDNVTLEITDILSEISEKHASYVINWGEMQKCKFSEGVSPSLYCKHLPEDAPLVSSTWEMKKPDPRQDLWVFPWVQTELKSKDWNLVLKLKPEPRKPSEDWVWAGELEATGLFSSAHDRYGYVEMRLR